MVIVVFEQSVNIDTVTNVCLFCVIVCVPLLLNIIEYMYSYVYHNIVGVGV